MWCRLDALKSIISALVAVTTLVASQSAAEVVRFTCTYPQFAKRSGVQDAQNFVLEFTLDVLMGNAFIVGNNGTSTVDVYQGTRATTFFERLSSGAVQVTVIALDGASAHSRHTIIGDDLVPSQYYGTCERDQGK